MLLSLGENAERNKLSRRNLMAVIGAHMLLYTPEPEALRAVLRDVFGLGHVDAGDGWLIFRLPPSELETDRSPR